MTLVEVETNREISTVFGTIAAGEKRFAAPSGDGCWLLYQWLPQGGRRGRAVIARAGWIVGGRQKLESTQRQQAAHADYNHARTVLGWCHDDAIRWVAKGYGKSLKTLRDWGFDTNRLEGAERRERTHQREVS